MSAAPRADLAIIDISGLPDDPAALAAIDAACRTWGCFHVRGHAAVSTLSASVSANLRTAMRTFFAQDPGTKQAIERTADNAWGYFDRELTKNTKDWKEIFDVGPADGCHQPQWPALDGFREAVEAYYAACESLAQPLLRALAAALGMPRDYLDADFDRHTSFLRLNHYPPCPNPAAHDAESGHPDHTFAISHHTDSGALTILLQDGPPALQLLRDRRWYLVEAPPDTLTVNIGDVVQVWSNDRYPAPVHRVLANATQPRFSVPFFFNPNADATYAPLPNPRTVTPPRYRAINWGEFRARRAAGDYADIGAEVQISDYRLD